MSASPAPVPTLSIALPNFAPADPGSWSHLLDRATAADAAGVDRVVVFDHVAFGEELDAYGDPSSGGTAGGKQPTGPDGHWLEPLTLLSVVAGATTRVRLATGILLAALRRPVVLAKTAATLDVLSNGRLDLGVGVGWQAAEYEAAGLPFADRGRLLDQSLEVCQTIWRDASASYEGWGLRFDDIHSMPKPRQPGGVPIWVSGRSSNAKVRTRVARFGAGWIPWGDDALDPAAGIARMRVALAAAGREGDPLLVAGTLPMARTDDGRVDLDRTMAAVPTLVRAGVTDFRAAVSLPAEVGPATAALRELVVAFRSTVGR